MNEEKKRIERRNNEHDREKSKTKEKKRTVVRES